MIRTGGDLFKSCCVWGGVHFGLIENVGWSGRWDLSAEDRGTTV